MSNFVFSARLEQITSGGFYAVSVPERVSLAVKIRGPIPVSARINGTVHLIASLSPAGGGRHRLRLNTDTRKAARIEPGDLVKVHISILSRPVRVLIPKDLSEELRAEAVLEVFKSWPAGKQNHIIDWIEKAARIETRNKRIRIAVEVAHRRRERHPGV